MATMTPEGVSLRFHGDPQDGESRRPPVSPDDPPDVRAPDDLATVRWLEFAAASDPPVRLILSSPAAVPAGLARPPGPNPAAVAIENVTAREDLMSVQLYGHPWGIGDGWPMITPCFRVTVSTLWEAAWALLDIPGR